MSPESDLPKTTEFFVLFESLALEAPHKIPLWTEVDRVAQVSPLELMRYAPCDTTTQASQQLLRPENFANNAKGRVFDTTPRPPKNFRLNTTRNITFSPKVEIKTIERRGERLTSDSSLDGEKDTPTKMTGTSILIKTPTHMPQIIMPKSKYVLQLATNFNGNTEQQQVTENKNTQDKTGKNGLELLDDRMLDLVPPDFGVIHLDLDNICSSSTNPHEDSDSVSYFSSDDDAL